MIEIERFAQAYKRHPALAERLFTAEEREELQGKPMRSWAGRFAAKEAVMKALGEGIGSLSWHDIAIRTDHRGQPQVMLTAKAQALAERRGGKLVRVSIAHQRTQAVAVAILSG
jgi:holo-[acyl-carrier protein] synthase